MRRLIVSLTLIAVLIPLATVLPNGMTVRATAPTIQNTQQVKRKPIQPDLPGTVSGASNPQAIPDTIAYELFMRSIADYPPETIFKDAGLTGDQIANAMSYLSSFQNAMSLFDQEARMIKKSGRGGDKLNQLQSKKEEFVERGLNHFLPKVLGSEGGNKIRAYINARVKPKTKRVSPAPLGVYVYCNSWREGDQIFGSGTILSDYGNSNQYLVTTTIVAPNGSRWSTSQTGWDYAAVTNTEYVSIMPNDGTFTVEVVFEGTNGYVTSALSTTTVAPLISIRSARVTSPRLAGPGSFDIVAEVQFSEGVPPKANAIIELNEAINFNTVAYDVRAASGVDVNGTGNTRVVRVGGGPGVKVITWPINVTTSGSGKFPSLPNRVMNDVRIESSTPNLDVGTGNLPVNFTIAAAAPSPSKSSSPVLCKCDGETNRSPIVIDIAGNGFRLNDTGIDIGSDDALLALDRNGNGTIDSEAELFGNFTPQPDPPDGSTRNGFLALAEYDKSAKGGYQDSVIDRNDAVFASLRLWQDTNHNGISESWELHTFPDLNLESISLDFRESSRTDQYGNQFRYRARVKDTRNATVGRWAWDVVFQ